MKDFKRLLKYLNPYWSIFAIAAVAIVILGATFLGGRPTAREEQRWSLDKLDVGGQIREQNRRSLQGLK